MLLNLIYIYSLISFDLQIKQNSSLKVSILCIYL